MTIAVFDPVAFKIRYPSFVSINDATLTAYFNEAELYLANTDNSIIQDVSKRTRLLWMITAHIAYLDDPSKPVGRVNTATEGSVSVGLEYMPPGSQAWFVQSQYGASFWQATSYLRSMRYFPNPTRY